MPTLDETAEHFVKEIQKEVYIRPDILKKLLILLLSIRTGTYLGNKPPRGILFYGPPGTGKTLLMRVIAKQIDISEPIIIRGPEVVSQYYGKSESRLREIFSRAEEDASTKGLALIFVDEIDSIAPRRDIIRGELEQRLVGQLLTLMDGLEKRQEKKNGSVIVIGSTNRPDALDPALRRPGRFDFEVTIDPPTTVERREILGILLKQLLGDHYDTRINLDLIAERTIGFTGADLAHLINEAILDAMSKNSNIITEQDLTNASLRVTPSGLRGYHIEIPRDRWNELGAGQWIEIKKDVQRFCSKPSFIPILLEVKGSLDISNVNKVAESLAYDITKNLKGTVFILGSASGFRRRWLGETEQNLMDFFERMKLQQPCVAYLQYLDSIANPFEEQMNSSINVIIERLTQFAENDSGVFLICSTRTKERLDPNVARFFERNIVV